MGSADLTLGRSLLTEGLTLFPSFPPDRGGLLPKIRHRCTFWALMSTPWSRPLKIQFTKVDNAARQESPMHLEGDRNAYEDEHKIDDAGCRGRKPMREVLAGARNNCHAFLRNHAMLMLIWGP